MRNTILRTILMAGVLATAATAHAQSDAYVAATAFADVRGFGSSRDIVYYSGGDGDGSLSGVAAGGGLRIGTFLHPRVSLEVSLDAGAKKTVDVAYPAGTARSLSASTEFFSAGATLGYHVPTRGRVHLGYRGGVAFIRGTYRSPYPYYVLAAASSTTVAETLPTAIYLPPIITERRLATGLTLGMEAAVDLTKRIAVVPEIRMTTFSQPFDGPAVFLIRPGVGVRWAF
jgi:hypothetical protein